MLRAHYVLISRHFEAWLSLTRTRAYLQRHEIFESRRREQEAGEGGRGGMGREEIQADMLRMLQVVCGVLQCVAVCCSVL